MSHARVTDPFQGLILAMLLSIAIWATFGVLWVMFA